MSGSGKAEPGAALLQLRRHAPHVLGLRRIRPPRFLETPTFIPPKEWEDAVLLLHPRK